MKIRARKGRSLGRKVSPEKSADSAHITLRHSPFLTALQDAVNEREGDSLAHTFAAIDAAAEALRRSVTLRNLKTYKELVREFVRLLTAKAYAVQQEAGFDQYGHRRLYTIVTQIDAKLEALTREVMKAQADNIDLVSRLDEIRGLLLDIYS
ncbi:MAG: YaaR family protein [Firmicutes bacterium]|nr:YaaR family protein [Bacillota bacterium]